VISESRRMKRQKDTEVYSYMLCR